MLLRTATTVLIAAAFLFVCSDSAEAGRRGFRRVGARAAQNAGRLGSHREGLSLRARAGQRFIPQPTAAEAPMAGFRRAFGPVARRRTTHGVPPRDRLGRGPAAGRTWRDVLGPPAAHGGNQGLPLQDFLPAPPAVRWQDAIGPPAAHHGNQGLPMHDTYR